MSTEQPPMTASPATPSTPAARRRLRDQQLQRSKVLAVLVVLVCVMVATVGVRLSDPETGFRVIKGEVGTMLKINGAELTISDIRVGQLTTDGEKIEQRTTGMFVLMRAQLANRDTLENNVLNHVELLSGKRVYEPYSSLSNIGAEPGYVSSSDFLFEVDPQQIDDLTLQIWNQGIVYGYHDRARIHLGITPDNADQWREAARDGLIFKSGYEKSEVLR